MYYTNEGDQDGKTVGWGSGRERGVWRGAREEEEEKEEAAGQEFISILGA